MRLSELEIVTVNMTGQLGNQMFGIAAGYALAKHNNSRLVLEFKDVPPLITEFELNSSVEIWDRSLPRLLSNSVRPLKFSLSDKNRSYEYQEDSKHSQIYFEEFFKLQLPVSLRGYFQSWKYFDHLKNNICELFQLKSRNRHAVTNFLANYGAEAKFTAVHIRKYEQDHVQFHGNLPAEYYVNSLRILRKLRLLHPIWIFTNIQLEGDEVVEKIKEEFEVANTVTPMSVLSPSENLTLMSQAESMVCANSSYSWWAAYLNVKADRNALIFPRPWFREPTFSTPDLIMPEWLSVGFKGFQ